MTADLVELVRKMSPAQRERILRIATPRVVERYMTHIPHPKQQVFLTLQRREAMYGGAAGGGKSDALLMAASQYVDIPGYSALILRRTWPDLNAPGAILDRARTWWKSTDARERDGGRVWEFPTKDRNGNAANPARISFGYMQYDKDKYKFQSAEYQFIGFDELTQFEHNLYTYLFSRLRRPDLVCLNCKQSVRRDPRKVWYHTKKGKCKDVIPDPKVLEQYPPAPDGMDVFNVPLRMRSATNPGGIGHEWVRARFVDPRTRTDEAVFVPARLSDNPSLDRESYEENLQYLLPVDRERLLAGDWDVVNEGEMFQRHWFKVQEQSPVQGQAVRFWDNASTAGGGDWTVGARVRLFEGRWYIEDIVRGQWSTAQKERIMATTAAQDGRNVRQRMEQEPGSSGKDVIDHMRRQVFVGYSFDGIRSTGSKIDRAAPVASAAEPGNVVLIVGPWNKAFLDEFSMFPFGANDDQVDAVSGAVSFLAGNRSKLLV